MLAFNLVDLILLLCLLFFLTVVMLCGFIIVCKGSRYGQILVLHLYRRSMHGLYRALDKRWKRVHILLQQKKQNKISTELNECYSTLSLSQDATGPLDTQTAVIACSPSHHKNTEDNAQRYGEGEYIDYDYDSSDSDDPVYEQMQ